MFTFWIGRLLVGFGWASDFKWDWTSDVGDEHSYFVTVGLIRRKGTPSRILYLTLGPVCASFVVKGRQ